MRVLRSTLLFVCGAAGLAAANPPLHEATAADVAAARKAVKSYPTVAKAIDHVTNMGRNNGWVGAYRNGMGVALVGSNGTTFKRTLAFGKKYRPKHHFETTKMIEVGPGRAEYSTIVGTGPTDARSGAPKRLGGTKVRERVVSERHYLGGLVRKYDDKTTERTGSGWDADAKPGKVINKKTRLTVSLFGHELWSRGK